MTFYETIRHLADSYGLIVIFGLYLALCLWPLRPGSRGHNQAAANSIFKDENDGE